MKSIQEIFENALFRVPDYQRGYSWMETHLDDFWQDMQNLREGRFHYTGALTLEKPTNEQLKKWKGDAWIIQTGNFKPYYIVDGQQRITTIIILLNILIDSMEEDDQFLYQSKSDLVIKYIYKLNEKNKLQSFIFGYEVDDPSYEFLKTRIFKQDSAEAALHPETLYTNNLLFADKFFRSKLKDWNHNQREHLFKVITQQLKFDLKIIDNELDIFVVFETMNNRGKPLTNLEKLKNRLIYLTSLMPDISEHEKIQLRREINDVWKTCYEYLGKNKKNPLNDDVFLRNHFIVYHFFEKTKNFPQKNIFKDIYTVQNTVNEKPIVNFNSVRKYIQSLQKASIEWYITNNPKHALNNNELISKEEAYWLYKLNRLGQRVFPPLTLSIFLLTKDPVVRMDYMKSIESFIFLNYLCAGRRSSLGNSEFPNIANLLYNKKNDWTIVNVINEINAWTFGTEKYEPTYRIDRFITTIKDQFSASKRSGYYDWPGIKYLLFEYEEFLQAEEPIKIKWSEIHSIEHVYPQSDTDASWNATFKEYTPKQRKIIRNSLGNLVLIKGEKNSHLSNNAFSYKKKHEDVNGNKAGFVNGSHSEIQISQYKVWNSNSIKKRGFLILDFLQKRWNITLTRKEMKQLLFADDTLISKI